MSERTEIPLEEMPSLKRGNSCYIHLDERTVSIHWDQALPDGPHKPTRVETMAAGALLGIARTLTGRGEEAVIDAIAMFEKKRRPGR